MKLLSRSLLLLALIFLLLIVGFNIWGALTLGTLVPAENAERDPAANKVVMVLGATGSAGDGLLKAALEDARVEEVMVITRRRSERIDAGEESGKLTVFMHQDFTDYAVLAADLARVNTVLWGLGTSSLQVDDETYTLIHVDFPLAFVSEWMAARTEGPMAFHFITGMGTDPEGDAHWEREKGRTENTLATLGESSPLRAFSYRSAYIRPAEDIIHLGQRIGGWLLRPGSLVITGTELGQAMLEISARPEELANGLLIDNADSIAYAKAYQQVLGQ